MTEDFDQAVHRGRAIRYGRMLAALDAVPDLDPEKVIVGRSFPTHPTNQPIYRYLIVARRRDQVEQPGVKHLSTNPESEPEINPDWELERVIDLATGAVVHE